MTGTVTIPVWLLLIIVALAVLAALDDVLLPTMRWYLRRRVNKVIDEVNDRLKLELPTFQITKRRVLIDRLIYDPEVMKTVGAVAAERGVSRDSLMTDVSSIAREMVPAFNAYFYFRLGYRCARWLLRGFYRVRLGFAHEQAMADIPPDTAVVFFINHRSNADYLLVTYLASDRVALSLRRRRMGPHLAVPQPAAPCRRLHPAPRQRRSALSQGAGALRPDGDGSLRAPRHFRRGQALPRRRHPSAQARYARLYHQDLRSGRPLRHHVHPVATNFDRVAEERTLVTNPDADFRGRGRKFLMGGTAKFVLRLAWRKLQGRSAGFGVACANFGEPLSLRAWSNDRGIDLSGLDKEDFFPVVQELGTELTRRILDVVPVLAVPLVSLVLTEADGPLDSEEIKRRAIRWLDESRSMGAHIGLEEGAEAAEIEAAVRQMRRRRLIAEQGGGGFAPVARERPLLTYYAASIVQLRAELQRKLSGP